MGYRCDSALWDGGDGKEVKPGLDIQDSMGGGRRKSPQRDLQVKDTGVTALGGYERGFAGELI